MATTKKIQQFKQWLQSVIAQNDSGLQLPFDRDLSRRFGISMRSIARVMKEFAEANQIERVHGKGTFVCKQNVSAPAAPVQAPQSAPERLAESILDAFRRGDLREGEALPSVKYMTRRFHVAPATVSGAYAQLVASGYVTRIGKTFWLGRFGELAHAGKQREIIVFVENHAQLAALYHPHTFLSSALRKMEDILSSSRYRISYRYLSELSELIADWRKGRTAPSGLVLYRHTDKHLRTYPAIKLLLKQPTMLASMPVLVDLEWGRRVKPSSHVTVLSRNHIYTAVGRTLGEYLRRTDYQTITLVIDNEFSRTGGFPAQFSHSIKLFEEIDHALPSSDLSIVLAGQPHNADIRQWIVDTFEFHAHGKYRPISVGEFLSRVRTVPTLTDVVKEDMNRTTLVFSRDSMAVHAIRLCQKDAIAIPGQCSLIGLENDSAYFHYGISACVPDWEAIGYLMAHSFLRDFPIEKSRKGFMQTRAKMICRHTTPDPA